MKIINLLFRIFIAFSGVFIMAEAEGQQTDKCNFTAGDPGSEVSAALPGASIKTGLDFNLAISVPGLQNCGDYTITIKTSDNIQLGSGNIYPSFALIGTNTYSNSQTISSSAGLNFVPTFKFKPGVTCNGEKGSFLIIISTMCGAVKKECELEVSISAIAINTWTVKKEHIWGDLSGGSVLWRISLVNSDPSGYGTYNLAYGSITDNISSGTITSVTNASSVTYSGSSATWGISNISNTTSMVQYDVFTTSCDPPNTVIKNCADFLFTLGKYECSSFLMDTKCATVKLTDKVTVNTNFIKTLSYNNSTVNYAQGCEGEYTIQISNGGNVPLANLQLTDQIPSGITVTAIKIYSSGANMAYTTTSPSGTGNTLTLQNFTGLSLTNPSTFGFNTTSGSLLGDIIIIKIRFTITAPTGTSINNCANLNYSGTYNGWVNICNISLPPLPPSGTKQSCAAFKVEAAKAIPGLKKCILSGQSYDIGQNITFRIIVSNHGQANLSGYTLSDVFSTPQFLEINSPISYGFGVAPFTPGNTSCINMPVTAGNPPSWLTANNIAVGSQNPNWVINGMPGDCSLDHAYYLVIEFQAKIRPGAWGNYTNVAKLTGATTLSSDAPYNIKRIGKLDIEKFVNSGAGTSFGAVGYVNPGQAFQYQLTITNEGSVTLNNIDIHDVFPTCVTPANATATVYRINGTSSTIGVSAAPALNFSPAVNLAPGEYIVVTINATRNANDNSPQCCNPFATVKGTAADNGMNVFSTSQQACIKSSLCCDLNAATLTMTSQISGYPWIGLNMNLTAGSLPIQEVTITLMDYTVSYNNSICRPANMGNLTGHLQSLTSVLGGGLNLAGPNSFINNSLTWKIGTPVNMNGGVPLSIRLYRPAVLNLSCCTGTINYCFKVTIKDVDCRVCEKIYRWSAPLPKQLIIIPEMQDAFDKGTLEDVEVINDKK